MGFNERNDKENLKFVDLWADYVRTHEDKVWSRQQNIIINSSIKTSRMTRKQFLHMKGEL